MRKNMRNRSRWIIGNKGVKIIMIQVQPGSDDIVYKKLNNHLKKLKTNMHIGNYCIYKAFGHHDLIVIYESNGLKPELLFEGTIPHILDANEVFCFSWEKERQKTFKINEKKLIGIIFFKIKPSISNIFGLAIERMVAEYIYKHSKGKGITFLGGLGWNEFILLAHEDNFIEVSKIIKSFTTSVVQLNLVEKRKKEKKTKKDDSSKKIESGFALKTYSIIGVNYKQLLTNRAIKQAFTGQKLGKEVSILLSIICRPQDINILSDSLEKTFKSKSVYFTIGKTDIRIIIDSDNCKDFAEFIIKLRRFRSKHAGQTISTSAEISFGIENSNEMQSDTVDQVMYINLDKKEIKNIRKYNLPSSELVIKAIYVFNGLIQNTIVSKSFFDLIPFMSTLRKNCSSGEVKSLDKKLERLRFGIDQRLCGTFLSQEGSEARFFPYKGGIQRILLASSVLPKNILKLVNKDWPGFLIAGFDHKYMHHDETLNLPLSLMFNPTEWWGLFHETGHVYMNLSNIINFDDVHISNKIENIGVYKREWERYTKYTKFLSELFADIFDYKVCFIGEFNLYIKAVWGYLIKEINIVRQASKKREQLADYLLRSFFVYIYSKYYDVNSKYKRKLTFVEVDNIFQNDFLPLLYNCNSELRLIIKKDEKQFVNEIPLRFADVKWFLNILIKKTAHFNDYSRQRRTDFRSKELLSQVKLIEKGFIIQPQNIIDPAILILKMKEREKQQSFRSNIAAILSLWDYYNYIYYPKTALSEM